MRSNQLRGFYRGRQLPVRPALLAALAALSLCSISGVAHAIYPERPVTLIVPFAPGGPTDIVARILATPFQKALGQSVVVENRGGAAGNIGMTLAARAAPDGYTLLLTSTAIAVNPALFKNLGYDPFKDFTPICELGNAPNVIVVKPDSGINTIADLVAHAKAAPGTFNYASPGAGTKSHLTGEQLKLRAGFQMVHVPYRGAGPAARAVLEGTVQVAAVALAAAEGLIKNGQLKALAVTGREAMVFASRRSDHDRGRLSGLCLRHLPGAVRARPPSRRYQGPAGAGVPGGDETAGRARADAQGRI